MYYFYAKIARVEEYNAYFDTNKKLWDRRTEIHAKSDFYDIAGFRKGKSSLNSIELDLLGDIAGKKILHLQCHFGLDTMSMSRMGGNVTGLDLSSTSIGTATQLAAELELDTKFIQGNVYDTPKLIDEKFDIVFTSYGALIWLPDLHKWWEVVNGMLRPGGQCIIAEFHPYLYSFDFLSKKVAYNYRNSGVHEEVEESSYSENKESVILKECFWQHSLEEVMAPFISSDYRISNFKEYYYSPYDCFDNSVEISPGKYVFGNFGVEIPHVYSLVAIKPIHI